MSEYIFTTSDNQQIPVILETRRGMHNITLRPKVYPTFEIHMSKPWLTPTKEAINFLETKRDWLEHIFNNAPKKQILHSGDKIMLLGQEIQLVHNPKQHGNTFADNTLFIGGSADMFQRRVRDTIKSELLSEIKKLIHSAPREYWPKHITLRDTSTRWGSCSTTGTISFSWRLAFAPFDVMRYVVMHELAHMKHMDHSPAFWHTVYKLYGPGYERAKQWLTKNGSTLHRYL